MFLYGLHQDGLIAPLVLDGAINGAAFLAYIEQMLCPVLRAGDVVICDNRHIRAGAALSPRRRATCTAPPAVRETCSCSPGIGQLRPRSDISTVIPMVSENSCR
jgi:hypothetical protein